MVPDANEPVTVTAASEDPDGVSSATVHWSAADAAWQSALMTIGSDGQLTGTIPGHSRSTIVQFYVEATDTLGTSSTFPAAGPASRALFTVQDNQSQLGARHNLRIIQTTADKNFANHPLNLWSHHPLGATVVLNEDQVYYDASIRYAGRGSRNYSEPERGYTIGFHTANKFLGVHRVITADRQLLGEMLLKHLHNHAGGIPGMYNDAIHFIGPSSSGLAMLRMAGFGEVYLDEQFAGGSDSTLFEKEMIYRPHVTTIRGDPESFKLNNPFQHNFEGNTDIGDAFYGTDKEAYRPFWLIKNNRDRDNYSGILALNEAFRLSGAALEAATQEVIDVDQWLRVLATIRLAGVDDWYSQPGGGVGRGSWNHNFFVYQRPTDGRLIMLPWDMDRFGSQSIGQKIVGNRQAAVADMILLPTNMRHFYGHFHDLINTTYNAQYGAYWASHYGRMFPGVDFQGPLNYIISRANAVLAQLPAQIPFAITSTDPLDVGAAATATIDGKAWIDAREIRLAGTDQPLQVTFKTDEQSEWADGWEVTLPLRDGTNDYVLQAYDYQGELVGTDTITVTTTLEIDVFDSLRITEVHYHPSAPTAAESAAIPGVDKNDFEFVEFHNVGAQAINLVGVRFMDDDGLDFTFPDTALPAGARGVIVKDMDAFRLRYAAQVNVIGQFAGGSLGNAGDSLTLADAQGTTIHNFEYDDTSPWPERADGDGSSLQVIDTAGDYSDAANWRASIDVHGAPGSEGTPRGAGDANEDGQFDSQDIMQVVAAGKFETGQLASWEEGDWDGDGLFTFDDVLEALSTGSYRDTTSTALIAAMNASVVPAHVLPSPVERTPRDAADHRPDHAATHHIRVTKGAARRGLRISATQRDAAPDPESTPLPDYADVVFSQVGERLTKRRRVGNFCWSNRTHSSPQRVAKQARSDALIDLVLVRHSRSRAHVEL